MAGKLGRLTPHPESTHPRLKLGRFLTAGYPLAPKVVDYLSRVPSWPMFGNDEWGDCVWADFGHTIQADTAYGTGKAVTVATDALLKGYSDVTGFDPNAGAPGQNATDQGTVIQDGLSYWRKTGIRLPNGTMHRILAFAQVDHTNPDEVNAALNLFGHLTLGINFPGTAMDQFDQGKPWDVVKGARIEGGHAINLGGETTATVDQVVTWAKVQAMTPAFWRKYVEEAWIVITPEWVNAAGTSPEGLDVAALNSAFTDLTGQPGPFPIQPSPTPVPVPPTPGPAPSAADQALAGAMRTWLTATGL